MYLACLKHKGTVCQSRRYIRSQVSFFLHRMDTVSTLKSDTTHACLCSDCYAADLQHHLNRCPSRKHLMKLDSKPFTAPNVNVGSIQSTMPALQELQEAEPLDGTEPRVAHSFELGLSGMHSLISKIQKIADQVRLLDKVPLLDLNRIRSYAGRERAGD